MPNNKFIGAQIKNYRKRKNLTQKDLALMIGKTVSSVQKYECGSTEIPTSVLEEIADVLGMDITSLLFVSQFADNPTEKIGDTLKRFDISSLMTAIDNATGTPTPLEQLTASFTKLNEKGQEKAASYVEDLTKIPEYKKTE
ncbi:MAG TPA: hypothetical protein DCX86_07620 [Coprococcus sp.]|nr:hypothetical protein [Coprococcus sp.]